MGKAPDMSGQKYGRLTVISYAGHKGGRPAWKCLCDCGKETVVQGRHIRSGAIKSCGCLLSELSAEQGRKSATHGMARTRLYHEWIGMKQRCNDPNYHGYDDYGGRGITICEEWRESFETFRDWALANGYRDDLTIERKNVNGHYCPGNCKWATAEEQANNRRNNRKITYMGETHTIAQWAEITGLSYSAIRGRLMRGWPVERILTEPNHSPRNK